MKTFMKFGLGLMLSLAMILGGPIACDKPRTFKATPERDQEIQKFLEIFRFTLLDGSREEYLNLFTDEAMIYMPELGRSWMGKPQVAGLQKLFREDFKSFELWFWDQNTLAAGDKAVASILLKFIGVHSDGSKEYWSSPVFLTFYVDDGIWRIDSMFARDTPFDIKATNPVLPPQSILVSKAKLNEMMENLDMQRPFLFGLPPDTNPFELNTERPTRVPLAAPPEAQPGSQPGAEGETAP